jgi:N-sulfoglucosamine sulfohydrolase
MPILGQPNAPGWDRVFISHTFHEAIDYYPMRGVRTREYKYIRNLFPRLTYPHATDLWASRTWQSIRQQGAGAKVGNRPVNRYLHREPEELYDVRRDPDEVVNLASSPEHSAVLKQLRDDTEQFRRSTRDPWVMHVTESGEKDDRVFG